MLLSIIFYDELTIATFIISCASLSFIYKAFEFVMGLCKCQPKYFMPSYCSIGTVILLSFLDVLRYLSHFKKVGAK